MLLDLCFIGLSCRHVLLEAGMNVCTLDITIDRTHDVMDRIGKIKCGFDDMIWCEKCCAPPLSVPLALELLL